MDKTIQKIEEYFKVPDHVANKIQNRAEKVRGGYMLLETRPRWDGSSGPWTRCPIAKIIYSKPQNKWKIYWHRASGKWNLYKEYKTLEACLSEIKKDKNGCFFG
jgi:hypothetical protein